MLDSRQETESPKPSEHPIEFSNDTFLVDAALIGQLLHLPAARVPTLMREGQITTVCERGMGEHEGEFRLTFFYRSSRARLSTDPTGRILRRSVIDFGDQPIPGATHRAGT